ncbi:MAG TPA: twitching motility protein PilT [Thermoplasmata archaeon]|nr:twitching motility protein PilT [Thermoplasmata archaeon]
MLLDTNALLLPFSSGLDLAAEIARHRPDARIAVPDAVRRELVRLAARGNRWAEAGARLADRYPVLDSPGRGDDAIVALATRERATVVTGDRGLRDRLRALGLRVLFPRGPRRLDEVAARRPAARAATVMSRPPLRRPSRAARRSDARRR